MPATNPIIEIRNLSAGYDNRTVLHDVNLTVYERDFLGIIGPNGGGKTTLIRCILGLLKPFSGTITYHPAQLSLGYLPQYTRIDRKFPITVEEVILSGLDSKKPLTARFTRADHDKARAVIARMGLEGMEKRPIGALSGGQLQRTLLGRAIISDPQVTPVRAAGRNQPRVRHHPRQPRHRHRAPASKVHRLRQRDIGLPPRHRHHARMAGTQLPMPHRTVGTRLIAPSRPGRTPPSVKG